MKRIVIHALVLMIILTTATCRSEGEISDLKEDDVRIDPVSPVLFLSGSDEGYWRLEGEEYLENVKVLTESFAIDDMETNQNTMYKFTIMGENVGFDIVFLYYRKQKEIVLCMCIEVDVDEDLNVQVTEVEALSGIYNSAFAGDELEELEEDIEEQD